MGPGFSPLDETLGLLAGVRFTPWLVDSIVRFGALVPFAQVPALLAHFTGTRVSAATVRRLTEAAGQAQVAVETAAVGRIEQTLPEPPAGPAIQHLSVDGAMAPLVGGTWAEVKTLAIGTVTPAAATDPVSARTVALSYFSRLADHVTFGRLATVETHRRGTETAQTVVAIVDGADWCQGFIDLHRPDAVRSLDFAHALEHLGAVAQAVYGTGTSGASEWLGQQAHALRHGQEQQVVERLIALATVPQAAEVVTLISATARYLATRQAQLRYQCATRPLSKRAIQLAAAVSRVPTSWWLRHGSKAVACTGHVRMSIRCSHYGPSSAMDAGSRTGRISGDSGVDTPTSRQASAARYAGRRLLRCRRRCRRPRHRQSSTRQRPRHHRA